MDIARFDASSMSGCAAGFRRDARPSRVKFLALFEGSMKTQKIEAPNGAIAVHQSAGQGPPVVLIHGNSSSSRAFSRQLEGLGSRVRLVAVDLPGHGESDDAKDPSAYSLPGHARAVRAVVEALDLHEARFVGWSLGGHVTLEMAPIFLKRAASSFSARRRSLPAASRRSPTSRCVSPSWRIRR